MRPVDPRLLRYAAAARGYLAVTVALGLVTTGLILAQAGLLAHALASAATHIGVAALAATLGLLLTVLAGRALTAYGGEIAALRAAATVKSQLRRRLAAHLTRLGPAWLGGQQAGEITTLTTKGLDALDPYFARFLPQLVLAFCVPVAVLARVTMADWISGVVIAVTLPLIPVFAVLIGLQTRAKTERQWQLLARLGGHFLDVVEGLPTLKMFGRAKAQATVIREVTDAHRGATMATLRVAFLSALVLELSAALATALVAVEVGLRLLAGHLDYQTALLVLLLTPEAYLPLRAVGAQFHASMEGVTAAARACEILEQPVPVTAGPAPRGLGPAMPLSPDLRRGTIRLNEITLAYPTRQVPALDGVTFEIRPGERIAVTGPSGAGKSSLLALLLRFTEPTAGQITVIGPGADGPPGQDAAAGGAGATGPPGASGTEVAGTAAGVAGPGAGVAGTGVASAGAGVAGPGAGVAGAGTGVAGAGTGVAGAGTGVAGAGDLAGAAGQSRAVDIAAVDLDAWRRQIAWVPQHPYLFEGSVASNIALGRPGAPAAAIEAAAAAAGAAEFIEALPQGYDTPLGERGARLSAGQRQRIAVARAFLRDAPLLLLDEPAAHLDSLTARALLDALERLMAGRTVLLVTHNLGTHGRGWTGGATRVIRLDHGRLVPGAGAPASGPGAPGSAVTGAGPAGAGRTGTAGTGFAAAAPPDAPPPVSTPPDAVSPARVGTP
jgi:thiol reductant ABC exporter CydD subunit